MNRRDSQFNLFELTSGAKSSSMSNLFATADGKKEPEKLKWNENGMFITPAH